MTTILGCSIKKIGVKRGLTTEGLISRVLSAVSCGRNGFGPFRFILKISSATKKFFYFFLEVICIVF